MSEAETPLVGVVMGSTSDWPTMSKAVEVLERFGVPHEARVVSAHRMPDEMFAYAETAAGLDAARIAYGTVSTMADLIDHPAATALPVPTPNGPIEVLAPPVLVDGKRVPMRAPPGLGEHDEALRREFAATAARSA